MTLEETKQNLLESDEFVLEEFKRLQVLYGLKHEMRYDIERTQTENIDVESVAEHIYGMHVIAPYFKALEDSENTWDLTRILLMITYHDIDEVETGDMIGYLKTEEDRKKERLAEEIVLKKLPTALQNTVKSALDEYNARETQEAQFARAIDKIEPLFQLFTQNGKKVMHRKHTTREQHYRIKDPYTKDFPYIQRFNLVVGECMYKEGYFIE